MSVPGYRSPKLVFSSGQTACVCGNPKKETQQFCRRCFDSLPAKMKYGMVDGDSTTRCYAVADASNLLRSKSVAGTLPAEQLSMEDL